MQAFPVKVDHDGGGVYAVIEIYLDGEDPQTMITDDHGQKDFHSVPVPKYRPIATFTLRPAAEDVRDTEGLSDAERAQRIISAMTMRGMAQAMGQLGELATREALAPIAEKLVNQPIQMPPADHVALMGYDHTMHSFVPFDLPAPPDLRPGVYAVKLPTEDPSVFAHARAGSTLSLTDAEFERVG